MSNDIPLFDGEMRIGDAGIFTYCHDYTHPTLKIAVKLIGTNHLGQRAYYRKIRQLLHDASQVFHEQLSLDSREQLTEDLVDLRSEICGNTALSQKFISALSAYFVATDLYFSSSMMMEAHAFQNESCLRKWVSVTSPACTDMEERLIKLCTHIPDSRQKSVVDHVRHTLDQIGSGSYTLREYGETFAFFWSDNNMRAVFDQALSQNEAKTCIQLLDTYTTKKNGRNSIGIKFGAAHIPNLRAALLSKGFAHVNSYKLCAVSFS